MDVMSDNWGNSLIYLHAKADGSDAETDRASTPVI